VITFQLPKAPGLSLAGGPKGPAGFIDRSTTDIDLKLSCMKFDDFEHRLGEDVMLLDDPAQIAAEVSRLLSDLDNHEIFAVLRSAKDYRAAINSELSSNEPDVVGVVRTLSAALNPLIDWIERFGIDCRSLRWARPI
jgi:hypothetical protein